MPNKGHEAVEEDEMQPEYDFSNGVQGKHHLDFRQDYKVIVHLEDGAIEERDFVLPEGVVALDPDVRAFFPDSDTVNQTLRTLISLIPQR